MVEKISSRQTLFILVVARVANIITMMPVIHMGTANQDIWIMILLSFFYSIILALPILFLSNRFSNLTIIGYMEKIFGKLIGKIIGILYALFFLRITILFFYIALQMIRVAFMTELRCIVIIIVLVTLCLYATTRGLEVLARTADLFGPLVIFSLIFITILGINKTDLTLLLPIYKDSGFIGINLGAIEIGLLFTEIYILAMNIPHQDNKNDLKKITIKFNLYSTLMILMLVVVAQTSLGIEQARHANFPFLTYVRMVRAYSIFERIESAFLTIWTLTITARIIAYLYISSYAFKEVFKVKNVNYFVYPLGIVTAIITYYYSEINPMLVKILELEPSEYIASFILKTIIPLLAVIVYFFRRKTFEREERLSD